MRQRDQIIWVVHLGRSPLRVLGGAIGLTALLACVATLAWAQYDISWYTVDGGGGMQAMGGPYTLGGTIGQPDAGVMTGGTFSLTGGFWVGGSGLVGVGDDDKPASLPLSFQLHAAAPNPLVRRSVVAFDLPQARFVRVQVYDPAGRLARTLAEGSFPAGRYQRVWDGTDNGGQPVGAGIYFVRLEAERIQLRQKIVLLR